MPAPQSYLLKFDRARRHLHDFHQYLRGWFETGRHSEWAEDDPDAPDHILIKASAGEIPVEPLSLIIGDTIQNFRASLDHLAFALAERHTSPLPEDIARDSQFPIVGDVWQGRPGQGPTRFASGRKRIRGIAPRAQAIIEELQPYKRGSDFASDPLWKLSILSNADKHRVLHFATIYPHVFNFTPGHQPEFPVLTIRNARAHSIETTGTRVTRNTVIARLAVTRSIEPHAQVKLEIIPSIAFGDGIAVNQDITLTLKSIETHIGGHIFPALMPFFP
jgi:hypothetical protein